MASTSDPKALEEACVNKKRKTQESERPRITLCINPDYISRLENRGEIGFCIPSDRNLAFNTYNLDITAIQRTLAAVLTNTLKYRYLDRTDHEEAEINTEIDNIVPATVNACMSAIYAKLRVIHLAHGQLGTRYTTTPVYNKEIEIPLPIAIAIQELGMFQTASLEENYILAPTYPEATNYQGRTVDDFNITTYQKYIPTFKMLGIPCKSVDPDIKNGSAWWTYRIQNVCNTTDLVCTIPPSNYTDLCVTLRMVFLAHTSVTGAPEIVTWPDNTDDYGVHLREAHQNFNVRAFLALCHGPRYEWSFGSV